MFGQVLREIASRPEVSAVRVEIAEAVPGDDEWPYSDRVWVITSAAETEVARWAEVLDPDSPRQDGEQEEPEGLWGWRREETPPGAAPIPPGQRPVELWWD